MPCLVCKISLLTDRCVVGARLSKVARMPLHRFAAFALVTSLTGMTAACGGGSSSSGSESDSSAVYRAPASITDVCGILDYQSFGQLITVPGKTGPADSLSNTDQERSASCSPTLGVTPAGSAASILGVTTNLTFWQDASTAKDLFSTVEANSNQGVTKTPVSGVGAEAYHYIGNDFGTGELEVAMEARVGNLAVEVNVSAQRPAVWTTQQLDGLYQMMADYTKKTLSVVQHASSTWSSLPIGDSSSSSS